MCQKEQETLKSALAHSIAALRPCTTRRALSAVSNVESNSFFGDLLVPLSVQATHTC